MPGLVVVNGATLMCTKSATCATSPLVIAGSFLGAEAEGQPVATINDHSSGINILPFPGDCMTDHQPCVPETPSPWTGGESATFLTSLVPLISASATLQCTRCGEIRIVSPGQSTFNADPPPEPEGKESGGGLLAGVAAVGGGALRGLGSGVRALPSLAGDAAAATPSIAGRVAGGAGTALLVPLIFPESTSDSDMIDPSRVQSDRDFSQPSERLPKRLPGFPNAKPAKPKTRFGGGLRRRWKDNKGKIYEEDRQHGTLEVYDKTGKHLGEFDRNGKQTKPADPTREVEP